MIFNKEYVNKQAGDRSDMVKMTNRLLGVEKRRLQKKTEEAKKRGGVSASLFLEGEMNALEDADCFFFYGSRLRPKGLLTVFFPDEEHAEITVAEYVPEEGRLSSLYRSALAECVRVQISQVHTVRNPAYGFSFEKLTGIRFTYDWSEYMLRIGMKELAAFETAVTEGFVEIKKETAPEGDGTFRYVLEWDGQEAAECRILPVADGRQCYLFGLKTKAAFLRKGMATRLLAGIAKEYADKEDAVLRLQVSSKNVPAERLYRKLGFVTEEEREYFKTEVC